MQRRAEAESPEDFYARVKAATGADGRLTVAVEEMPGWDIYPYEIDSLRLKPLQPLADDEPAAARRGPCRLLLRPSARPDGRQPGVEQRAVAAAPRHRHEAPDRLNLAPREHCDLPTVPDHLADEMGQLIVAVSAGVEHVPSVGRVQLAKYGDGGAHLHLFFFGRPARMLQLRGSPLLDWEENLPRLPLAVLQANARVVAQRLLVHVGGQAGTLGRGPTPPA